MADKEEMIYINCFFYSFLIKKSELKKFNIEQKQLEENTQSINKNNNNDKNNNKNYFNILNNEKILKQLKSCNFEIIYKLLTIKEYMRYI